MLQATQFHPEKSGATGLRILHNFLSGGARPPPSAALPATPAAAPPSSPGACAPRSANTAAPHPLPSAHASLLCHYFTPVSAPYSGGNAPNRSA